MILNNNNNHNNNKQFCNFAGSEGEQPGDGGGSGEKWRDPDQEGRCWSGKQSPCVLLL